MDTSREYAGMCIKAWPDITKIYNPVFSRRRRMLYTDGEECYRWDDVVRTTNHSEWFPVYEQDQLQEIAFEDHCCNEAECLLIDFKKWVNQHNLPVFNTFEKLWLAFVMSKKFSKKLDDKEWVTYIEST